MGGAVASELAKLYPEVISKLVLWAPAFNLPMALDYLTGKVEANQDGLYDHGGFEISQEFVDDMLARDFYDDLDIYKNDLLIIHGTEDTTVPFDISKLYVPKFIDTAKFIPINGANHNYDSVEHIKKVLKLSLDFLVGQ